MIKVKRSNMPEELKNALEVIRRFQDWRKGEYIKHIQDIASPGEISAALETVLQLFEGYDKPRYSCKGCKKKIDDMVCVYKNEFAEYKGCCRDFSYKETNDKKEEEKEYRRVQALKDMDSIVRSVNDEESGIFEDWVTLHVPDGANEDEFKDFANDEESYTEACEFFARRISEYILDSGVQKDGWSTALYRPYRLDYK